MTGATGSRGLSGSTGSAGSAGSSGVSGVAGPAGPAGPAGGPTGPQGLQGVHGDIGAAGPAGAAGATGSQGTAGATGPQGTAGSNGPAGTTGSTGPTGATGPANGLSEYAYVYNDAAQTVAVEADVNFNKNGVLTSGITHTSGTPGAAGITLLNAGDYKVTFSVSGTELTQMALFVNATLAPGTVYGAGAGTAQNSGQVIVHFAAGDVLTLRNHTSAAAIGLAAAIGGTRATASASVVIEKLN